MLLNWAEEATSAVYALKISLEFTRSSLSIFELKDSTLTLKSKICLCSSVKIQNHGN